jgi:putative ABC transport system substrate-binding protein
MRRRDLIGLVGALALAAPQPSRAQPARMPTIGVLVVGNPEPFWGIFRAALADLGYAGGRNIRFELRSGENKPELLPLRAAELVRLKVDIIVASLTPAVEAARRATGEIPIVMAAAGDPVATGLIASLARPGGNITGMSGTSAELAAKNLELVRELLPAARRVGVLANPRDSFTRPLLDRLRPAAHALGFELLIVMIGGADEFEAAFAALVRDGAAAVFLQPSLPHREPIVLAMRHRLPVISSGRAVTEAGALLSYSGSFADIYRHAATYVDRILKGSKPADLPVGQPTTFDVVVNLKAAKALGITVPSSILVRDRGDRVTARRRTIGGRPPL